MFRRYRKESHGVAANIASFGLDFLERTLVFKPVSHGRRHGE